jgi:hypothetical protein
MAAEEKTNYRELSLGDDFGPAVVRVNGLTVSTDGNGNIKLQNGSVTVDITDGNTSVFDNGWQCFGVIANANGTVQSKPPVAEQTNEIGVIASSVDKRAVQIGDVLGQGFDLPEGLERLDGWLIYNITDEGVPQALEPKESAPEGVVGWNTGMNHAQQTLKKQGHTGARLWTEADGKEIFNNVVKGGHNDKAQLDVSASNPNGRYWEGTTEFSGYSGTAMLCYLGGGFRFWEDKVDIARVRTVQDVPELSR